MENKKYDQKKKGFSGKNERRSNEGKAPRNNNTSKYIPS